MTFCCFWNYVVGNDMVSQPDLKLDKGSEQKPPARELPEYLKQKLRARGILKEDTQTEVPVRITILGYDRDPSYLGEPSLTSCLYLNFRKLLQQNQWKMENCLQDGCVSLSQSFVFSCKIPLGLLCI